MAHSKIRISSMMAVSIAVGFFGEQGSSRRSLQKRVAYMISEEASLVPNICWSGIPCIAIVSYT